MNDWLHNLPVWWMTLVVFAITYLTAGVIFAIIMALAKGERVRAFKSVSAAMLGPLGTLFGLLVVFSVVQVWGDIVYLLAAARGEKAIPVTDAEQQTAEVFLPKVQRLLGNLTRILIERGWIDDEEES
jgi:hypothetical protein